MCILILANLLHLYEMQHNYKLLGLLLLFGLVSAIKAQSADSTASDTLIKFKKELIAHTKDLESCAFSHNGKWLASAGWDKNIKLMSADTSNLGTVLKTFTGNQSAINKVVFSPNDKLIASAGKDFVTRVWDIESEEMLFESYENTNEVTDVHFSPDGNFITTASKDGSLRFYDLYNQEKNIPPKIIDYKSPILDLEPTKSGKTFVVASTKNDIDVIDLRGRVSMSLIGHNAQVNSIKFSPTKRLLASGSDDNTIIIWNMATKSSLFTLTGHEWHISSVAWSYDERYLLSTSIGGEAILWDAKSGEQLSRFQHRITDARSIGISPNLKQIIVAGKIPNYTKGVELYTTGLTKIAKRKKPVPRKGKSNRK